MGRLAQTLGVKETMELLIIAAVAVVLWFVVSGSYKTKLQDPQTLRPAEIEDSIIELKKSILITSAYTAEKGLFAR